MRRKEWVGSMFQWKRCPKKCCCVCVCVRPCVCVCACVEVWAHYNKRVFDWTRTEIAIITLPLLPLPPSPLPQHTWSTGPGSSCTVCPCSPPSYPHDPCRHHGTKTTVWGVCMCSIAMCECEVCVGGRRVKGVCTGRINKHVYIIIMWEYVCRYHWCKKGVWGVWGVWVVRGIRVY